MRRWIGRAMLAAALLGVVGYVAHSRAESRYAAELRAYRAYRSTHNRTLGLCQLPLERRLTVVHSVHPSWGRQRLRLSVICATSSTV